MDLAQHYSAGVRVAADYVGGGGHYYEYCGAGVHALQQHSDADCRRDRESHHGSYWQWQHSDGSSSEGFQHRQPSTHQHCRNVFADCDIGRWGDCSPSPEQLPLRRWGAATDDDGLPKNERLARDDSNFRKTDDYVMQKRGGTGSSSSCKELLSPTVAKKRRLAANARERRRMNGLNEAFDRLREAIPTSVDDDHKMSKYETLQMAQSYISALCNLLNKATQK